MGNKNAVFSICIGDFYKDICEITYPTIKNYADKINSDFLIITETCLKYPHYVKFEIKNLLDKYDRVLYLDSDILISPKTPDIFDLVPENKLGMLDESILGYHTKFIDFLNIYGKEYLEDWLKHKKCYNAGVIVCSKQHKNIFELPQNNLINHYFEQSYLNLRLLEEKTEIFELPIEYNRMIYLDTIVKEHRLKSYIIHYAGIAEKMNSIQYKNFLKKEYKMLISQDFSKDDVKIIHSS